MFKGFNSYAEAHTAWRAFIDHGTLPLDVISSLFGKLPPVPPTLIQPNIGGLANPPAQTVTGSPRMPASSPSFGSPRMPASSPSFGNVAISPLASDPEEFWVVLSGVSPGVYQGG